MKSITLASASPRRRELLEQIGVSYQLLPMDINEAPHQNESPKILVARLALEKAQAAWHSHLRQEQIVLAADTIVEYDGQTLGKPKNQRDAIETLLLLSESIHTVSTAFCVLADEHQHVQTVTTTIHFGTITPEQALAYWHTGEPKDKAGGYGIQGRGAIFVKHIEGSYTGVVGLPLYECQQALFNCGVKI